MASFRPGEDMMKNYQQAVAMVSVVQVAFHTTLQSLIEAHEGDTGEWLDRLRKDIIETAAVAAKDNPGSEGHNAGIDLIDEIIDSERPTIVAAPCPCGARLAGAGDDRQFQRTPLHELPQSVGGLHTQARLGFTFSISNFGRIEANKADIAGLPGHGDRVAVDYAHAGRINGLSHC